MCGEVYSMGHRINYDTQCPKCGFSENEIHDAGTNDRVLIAEFRQNNSRKVKDK
jgi:hypothetical protein